MNWLHYQRTSAEATCALAVEEPSEYVLRLKYPELAFPYEALPDGRLKTLVDKACEGGLSPGLVCPAIIALASAIPAEDRMEGANINQYICLLALVGAGKDTAINRALGVLGLEDQPSYWTAYSPSGERSISNLIGDKQGGTKANPTTIPGLRRHCIVTYEIEDTLAKSRGETSSVLQALQWYWDHNKKTYSDSKTGRTQNVNCRLSWLTALPVGDGEIDEDTFRHAFGEHTSHGITDRMLFGFAEEKFDGRRSRRWSVPYDFNNFTVKEPSPIESAANIQIERQETLVGRLHKAKVIGFADGVEDAYLNWDASGRDTYHVLKVAVLVALLNDHKHIEMDDWLFAVALMDWQKRIRTTFAPGKSKKVTQGQFNEIYMHELEKRVEKMKDGITNPKSEKIVEQFGKTCYYVRWKAMANANRWYRFGLNVEKTTESLMQSAAVCYLLEPNEKGELVEENRSWVRLAGQ